MSDVMLNTRLSGEYKFIIKSQNGMVKETDWVPNLILNQGLNRLGYVPNVNMNIMYYASVGTGTSTPVVTQTSLDAPIAYSSTAVFVSIVNSGAPSYTARQTFSYTFAQGAVTGNISEVGVGSSGTLGGNLFSRALIVDGAGNPTTITLTPIDQLIVYYRLSASPPLVDYTGTLSMNSTTYGYTTRILGASDFTNQYTFQTGAIFSQIYGASFYGAGAALAPITSDRPLGTASGTAPTINNSNTSTYVTGTYYNDWTINCSATEGNSTGGIQAIAVLGGGPWQAIKFQTVFNTPIPKTNTTSLSLTFRYSWSR